LLNGDVVSDLRVEDEVHAVGPDSGDAPASANHPDDGFIVRHFYFLIIVF
jgi:hypothetical protein